MIKNILDRYRGPKWIIASIIIPFIKFVPKIISILPDKIQNTIMPILKFIDNLSWGWTFTISLSILVVILTLWDPHYKKWIWKLKKYESRPWKKDLIPIELNDGSKIISASWGVLGDNKELIHVLRGYVIDGKINLKATKEVFGNYPPDYEKEMIIKFDSGNPEIIPEKKDIILP